MNKRFNLMRGGYAKALENLRRFRIRLYVTFIFGYDWDTPACFDETVEFAHAHGFYITAFNHLTPFPGTRALPAPRVGRQASLRRSGGWTIATVQHGPVRARRA